MTCQLLQNNFQSFFPLEHQTTLVHDLLTNSSPFPGTPLFLLSKTIGRFTTTHPLPNSAILKETGTSVVNHE